MQEAQARAELMALSHEARRFYNGQYHQYLLQLPESRRLVESLFMTFSSGSEPHAAADTPDDPLADSPDSPV